MDGHVDAKEELVRKKVGDSNYSLFRVVATIHSNFDLSKYPLDNHTLRIQIEDGKHDAGDILYRADTANSNFSERVQAPQNNPAIHG